MKRVAQILILTSILCLAAGPGLAAEGAPVLATLQISLWPEYDRPGVLVIYRGLLAEDTTLPAPMEIRIPAAIGIPTALAYVDGAGQRLNLPYTTRTEGEDLVVSFEVPTLSWQLEYYASLPTDDAGRRTYTFDYRADYAVSDLGVEFQVPPTATGFSLDPPADSVIPESNGLVYHVVQAGAMAQGESRSWTFVYDKDNSDLTAPPSAQQQTPSALPTTATAAGDSSTILIFFVAFVALVAVGAVAFWLGRRTGGEDEAVAEVPFPARKKRQARGRGGVAFCYRCGAELRLDSEFCHKCGADVRSTRT